jgi:hypothetical protein
VTERTTTEDGGTIAGLNWFDCRIACQRILEKKMRCNTCLEIRKIRFCNAECEVETRDRAMWAVARNLFDDERISRVL